MLHPIVQLNNALFAPV